jgi:hypothetical protein
MLVLAEVVFPAEAQMHKLQHWDLIDFYIFFIKQSLLFQPYYNIMSNFM